MKPIMHTENMCKPVTYICDNQRSRISLPFKSKRKHIYLQQNSKTRIILR